MNEETAQTNETVETTESTESLDSNAVSQDKVKESTNAEVSEEKFEDAEQDATASKEQSKEENAKFAKERREREKAKKAEKEAESEAQRKRELEKVRFDTIKETLGGINPYTKQEIVDEYDINEYLIMKKMEKEGLDPIADYASYTKRLQREEKQAKEAEIEKSKKNDWVKNDRAEFAEKYPDVNLKELFENEMFQKFSYGKVGSVPMASIYESYQGFVGMVEKKAKEDAAKLVAKADSSPGSLSNKTSTEPEFYTLEQLKKLSREEVRNNMDKVIASEKRLRGK